MAVIIYFDKTQKQQIHQIESDQNKNKFQANVRGDNRNTGRFATFLHSEGAQTSLIIF